jgi:integrase/recombinase XerD
VDFTKPLVPRKKTGSFVQATVDRDEALWQELSKISLLQAADQFLKTLNGNTLRAYKAAFNSIFDLFSRTGLFDPQNSLQMFSLSNLEYLLDQIRTRIVGTEATKQARAAAFIALTGYLQRATGGMIRKAIASKGKGNLTFRQIRESAITRAMTQAQWMRFLGCLKHISFRDYLVAKTVLQGAKRIGEVLHAQINQINWMKNQIIFKQFKSREVEKYTIITYSISFMEELRQYLGNRKEGYIFLTRNGKPLTQSHIYRTFAYAGLRCGFSFRVHPHMLRASAITYLASQGYSVDQIMRVSGHSDSKLVRYYDKTPIEQNPSQEVSLIS